MVCHVPLFRFLLIRYAGIVASYGNGKKAVAVKNCRKIGKKDMKLNNAMPKMTGQLLYSLLIRIADGNGQWTLKLMRLGRMGCSVTRHPQRACR
jgi:hypothetical protein